MKLRLLVVALLYVAMLTGAFGLLAVDSNLLLDLRLSVSLEEFDQLIEKQVSHGRSDYLWFHGIDYLFIVLFYPLLRSVVLRLTAGRRVSRLAGWFATLAGIFDLVENLSIDLALLSYPVSYGWIAPVVQIATPLKFLGIMVALATLLAALVFKAFGRIKSPKTS